MAQTAHLTLTVNGTQLKGDSTISSMDREDTIEVLEVTHEVLTPRDHGSGLPTGQRIHNALIITKRIDKTSPLLYKAMCENEVVDKAIIRFYRPNPAGDGSEQHYYSIVLSDGRISQVKLNMPNVLVPETANLPSTEKVALHYATIRWTWEEGGIEHEDSWMTMRA